MPASTAVAGALVEMSNAGQAAALFTPGDLAIGQALPNTIRAVAIATSAS